MIHRLLVFGVALPGMALSAPTAPAHAQSDEVAAVVGVGYVVLGIAALTRMISNSDDARVGSVVRLTAGSAAAFGPIRGTLTALDVDSITVVADGVTHRIARGDVRDMSSFAGRERKWAQGFVAGFAGGAALGAVAGFASGDDHGGDIAFTAGQKAAILGVFGAFSGSLVGTLVGTATQGDHWVHVDRIPAGSRVTVAPIVGGRGTGVGVNIKF